MTLKKKRLLIVFVFLTFALILILVGIGPALMNNESRPQERQILQEVPEAEIIEAPESKSKGYRSSQKIDDYFDSLEERHYAEEREQDEGGDSRRGRQATEQVNVEDLFLDSDIPKGDAPHKSQKPKSRPEPKTVEKTSVDRKQEEPVKEEVKDSIPEKPRPQVKRSGAVSSLDEDVTSDLGNGFSTLDGRDAWLSTEESKPYQCMFTRSEKVRSGQRIAVRLLEDLVIGNTHIPRNTHLQGVCSISDRMEISLTSLDMGGKILTFHFEAYDTDGQKGIYCSNLSQVVDDITDKGLSMGISALNSRVGRTAREIASVGASIVRNKKGEITVNIPSGYTFYIIEKQ